MWEYTDMDVGGVFVNDISTFRTDQMPYGGAKCSRIDREGPRSAIEEMSGLRLKMVNRAGGME